MSDDQAIVNGVVAGVFETLFEKVSLESLITMKAPAGSLKQKIAGTLKNSLKQAGIEGSEELATSAANLLFDRIANGQMADAQQRIYVYMAQGMSYDAAHRQMAHSLFAAPHQVIKVHDLRRAVQRRGEDFAVGRATLLFRNFSIDFFAGVAYTDIGGGCVRFNGLPRLFYIGNVIQDFLSVFGFRDVQRGFPDGIIFVLNVCFPVMC